tara:strand:+ start:270 stop:482 length:213 start_codon:yes stop_codon:yes gene_type:complete
MPDTNGWNEYKNLVLTELKRANKRLVSIEDELSSIKQDLAILKTKMYFGSAVIAMVFSGVVSLVIKSMSV